MCSNCNQNCFNKFDERFIQFIGRRDFIRFHEERLRRFSEERNDCFCNRHQRSCSHCKSSNRNANQFLDVEELIRLHEDRLRGIRFEDRRCGSYNNPVNHLFNGCQTGIVDRCTCIFRKIRWLHLMTARYLKFNG
jgi:hypothetical protein